MKKQIRKIVLILAIVCVVVGGYFAYKALTPSKAKIEIVPANDPAYKHKTIAEMKKAMAQPGASSPIRDPKTSPDNTSLDKNTYFGHTMEEYATTISNLPEAVNAPYLKDVKADDMGRVRAISDAYLKELIKVTSRQYPIDMKTMKDFYSYNRYKKGSGKMVDVGLNGRGDGIFLFFEKKDGTLVVHSWR